MLILLDWPACFESSLQEMAVEPKDLDLYVRRTTRNCVSLRRVDLETRMPILQLSLYIVLGAGLHYGREAKGFQGNRAWRVNGFSAGFA